MIIVKIAENIKDVERIFKELVVTQVYIVDKRIWLYRKYHTYPSDMNLQDMCDKAKKANLVAGVLGDLVFIGDRFKIGSVLKVLGVSEKESEDQPEELVDEDSPA